MKLCPRCNISKELRDFHKDKSKPDGLRSSCKECVKDWHDPAAAAKRRALYTPEQIQWNKDWYKRNPDKKKAKDSRWIKNNPEKYRLLNATYKKKYWKRYPGLSTALTWIAQLRKSKHMPKWITREQRLEIIDFYKLCKELQWLSDPTDPLQVDHIEPLHGKNDQGEHISCGLHVPWNLQIIPRSHNIKKGTKIA